MTPSFCFQGSLYPICAHSWQSQSKLVLEHSEFVDLALLLGNDEGDEVILAY